MFEKDIQAAFDDPIWADAMENVFHNQMHNDPTNKSIFMQTPLWHDINAEITKIAAKYGRKTNTILASLAETCDGGCLEASIVVSYVIATHLSAVTINLASPY